MKLNHETVIVHDIQSVECHGNTCFVGVADNALIINIMKYLVVHKINSSLIFPVPKRPWQ